MTQNLFKLKVKKTVSETGQVTRYYTFVIREPENHTPPADCKMYIKDGKVEDIEVSILDDDRFDINSFRMSVIE